MEHKLTQAEIDERILILKRFRTLCPFDMIYISGEIGRAHV